MDHRGWWVEDATRLRAAAVSRPQAPVPTCPGWVARDLVDHVGEVYAHERAVLRLGRRPVEGEWPWAPDDDTVFEWFDVQLAGLLEELDRREPTEPAWTFYTADQTVGFWWRRMAHETAIHRVDAELAAGTAVAPHEDSQAIDGVAELLALAGDPAALADPGASLGSSGSVLVSAGASTVLVSMQDGEQFVEASSGPADAVVLGAATDVYRALWNRPGVVQRSGDPLVLQRFDARLAVGMS